MEFSDEKDSVSLEGPPQEVEKAQESLETFIRELVSKQYTMVSQIRVNYLMSGGGIFLSQRVLSALF